MSKRYTIKNSRHEYKLNLLSEETVHINPFRQFRKWFRQVVKARFREPYAMILATADKNANPSLRVVLMKGFDESGITFFTNYKSRKGIELDQNSSASLLFYWSEPERQVRIEGKIRKISRKASQEYFDTRPVKSRLAAWASAQSKIIPGREYLELQFRKLEKKFSGKKIPVPPYWGGYKLIPTYFEFWQGRENRLHDRIAYRKLKQGWKIFRLAP